MSVIAEPEARQQGIEWVRSFRKLSPKKKARVYRLLKLMEDTEDPTEQDEIALAIVEIVLPKLIGLDESATTAAESLDDDVDQSASESLAGYYAETGRLIRRAREAKKMTQQQLADKSGLPQSHICRLEMGKHAPTRKTILKIAEALNVQPSSIDLLFDD